MTCYKFEHLALFKRVTTYVTLAAGNQMRFLLKDNQTVSTPVTLDTYAMVRNVPSDRQYADENQKKHSIYCMQPCPLPVI